MKKLSRHIVLSCLASAAAATAAHATTVFSDNFETDTGQWTFGTSVVATPPDLAQESPQYGGEANAFKDYSALVPPSPAGGTHGMTMIADTPGTGLFSGLSMALNSQTFDFANKPYKITANVWLNYYGGTTSGTTEMVTMGIGGTPGTAEFPGTAVNGVMFASSTDGDTTSTDWRVYTGVGAPLQPVSKAYASDPTGSGTAIVGGPMDSANSYWSTHFPGLETPPQLQKSAFPDQQTSPVGMPASPGTVAFAWHRWTITTTPNNGPISWYISDNSGNDVLVATVDGTNNPYTITGNSLYFGMFDINSSSPPTGFNADKLLFGLVDDVKVEDLSHITGDTDNNGIIDLTDLNNVLNNFGAAGTAGDENADGHVDLTDLNDVLNNFGGHEALGLSTVPEPASLSLVGLATAGILARRRRA